MVRRYVCDIETMLTGGVAYMREALPDETAPYVLASDHEREVAGLREASDIRARQYLDDTKRLEADRDALQKRCWELEKALEKYGRHTKFCYAVDIWDSDKGCTCGFAALRPAEGEGPTSCETHGVDNCPTCPPAKRGEKP